MLRIAKSTPGVLDLSAVKDEHGLPVTLIGPSHRDVPDHEGDNLVLQRIVELGWVTLSRVPIATSDEAPPAESDALDPPPVEGTGAGETGAPDAEGVDGAEPSTGSVPTTDAPPPEVETRDGAGDAQGPVLDAGSDQPPGEPTTDAPARSEGAGKPTGRSDSRRAGRRS